MDTVRYSPQPIQFEMRPLTEVVEDTTKKALLEEAIAAYSAQVGRMNQAQESALSKKDPFVKPDWCQYGPHPPEGYVPAPVESRQDLPGCPNW